MIAATNSSASARAWKSWTSSSCSVSACTRSISPLDTSAAMSDSAHPGRRVHDLAHLALAVHVHPARQARIEAVHRAHDVDPLEVLRTVLLEDRRVLHGVLVGPRRAVYVAGVAVPR